MHLLEDTTLSLASIAPGTILQILMFRQSLRDQGYRFFIPTKQYVGVLAHTNTGLVLVHGMSHTCLRVVPHKILVYCRATGMLKRSNGAKFHFAPLRRVGFDTSISDAYKEMIDSGRYNASTY